jgi:hypothetical protein
MQYIYILIKFPIAGETVFYNSNILHLGTYDPSQKRATLHACIGDTRGGSTRARNVLQHGLTWMGAGGSSDREKANDDRTKEDMYKEADAGKRFVETLTNERAKMMWRNLRRMQQQAGEGGIGYSQMN